MSDAPISCMTRRPLCREYVLARFGSLMVQVDADEDGQAIPVRWALGLHVNQELEVLGLWLGVKGDDWPWPQISSDLRDAGVERIRFISTAALGVPREELIDADEPPRVELLRSGTRVPTAVSPRAIRLAETAFQRMNASLIALAKKHSRFANNEAAVSMLTRRLGDAAGQLARKQAMSNSSRSTRRTAAASALLVQA